ncbi:MAG: class I SAM-dependent methyltransferase [Candidatus Omnitrophota bacterium]|jgi:demethylmenaquinone methyltransferase/2-methoxy-6-polyprenyl-1,4-benzoquinol methylase
MAVPDKEFIRNAFDSITPRYDLLNQILSFGMAEAWRKRSAEILLSDPDFSPKTILDLGCGTGKFLECFLRRREQQVPASVAGTQDPALRRREQQVPASVPGARGPGVKGAWESATGVDFSAAMLKKARETVSGNVMWLREDFDSLPFLESSFDLVISGFTLRSVQKLPEFLGHVYRILTPGGKAAFLDLTRPRNFWARLLFFPYLKFILPLLGWLLTGNLKAYHFLSGSVRSFQSPEETIRLMQNLGYRDSMSKSFAFGAATLIIGTK